MKLLKCVACREYITHAKEHIRNHEVQFHSYGNASYVPHQPRHQLGCKCLPCVADKMRVVANGEERIGKQYFIDFAG